MFFAILKHTKTVFQDVFLGQIFLFVDAKNLLAPTKGIYSPVPYGCNLTIVTKIQLFMKFIKTIVYVYSVLPNVLTFLDDFLDFLRTKKKDEIR